MNNLTSNRRNFLTLGGATLMLAFVEGKLRAADCTGQPLPEGDAYAPWRLWNDPSIRNTPLALVAAGVVQRTSAIAITVNAHRRDELCSFSIIVSM